MAIEKLPKLIIEEQSIGVEGVSGTSMTSDAILSAISECIAARAET